MVIYHLLMHLPHPPPPLSQTYQPTPFIFSVYIFDAFTVVPPLANMFTYTVFFYFQFTFFLSLFFLTYWDFPRGGSQPPWPTTWSFEFPTGPLFCHPGPSEDLRVILFLNKVFCLRWIQGLMTDFSFVFIFMILFLFLSVYLPVYQSIYLLIYVYQLIYLAIYLAIQQSVSTFYLKGYRNF